ISLCVKSHFNNFFEKMDCIMIPKITQHLSQHFIPMQNVSISKHIKLADPKLWEIEHSNIVNPFSPEEKVCEELFLQRVSRNLEGRFIVKLPIKHDKLNNVKESKDIALRRFKSLEKRLITQPCIYNEYKKFMDEYIQLNYMKEVNSHTRLSPSSPVFYPCSTKWSKFLYKVPGGL
ncbi:hypothetical protein ALC56_01711, partial [Trachymyrmex septentrionalis]